MKRKGLALPSIESRCNCLALRQAARHISQIYDRHLAQAGLRTTQYSILGKLKRLGPMPIKELAAAMVMDRTTLGRNIRPLERDNLLEIAPAEDGRKRTLRITAAGEARFKMAHAKWEEAQLQFETEFGPSEAEDLRFVLHRMIAVTGSGG